MKNTFTYAQVKELIGLTDADRSQVIDYCDKIENSTEEQVLEMEIDKSAPRLLQNIQRKMRRRASSAIRRRERAAEKQRAEATTAPAVEPHRDIHVADSSMLSSGARARIAWYTTNYHIDLGRVIDSYVARIVEQFNRNYPVESHRARLCLHHKLVELTTSRFDHLLQRA